MNPLEGTLTALAWLPNARGRAIPPLSPRLLLAASVVLLLLFFSPLPAASAQENQNLPPELEQRAQYLYTQLMCPTCPGQNIGQSSAPISANMRAIVREKLLAGESNEQILAFFVEAYGESVLASPPRDGVALAVWLVPPLALALGGLAVFLVILGLRRAQAMEAAGRSAEQPASLQEGLDPYLTLVDSELGALEADESHHTTPSPSARGDRS